MIQIAVSIICLFYIADSSYKYGKNSYVLKEKKEKDFKGKIEFWVFTSIFYICGFSSLSMFVKYQVHIPLYLELFILVAYAFFSISVSLIATFISTKKYKN